MRALSWSIATEREAYKAAEAAMTAAEEAEMTQKNIDKVGEQSGAMVDDADRVPKKCQDSEAVPKECEEKVADVRKEDANVKAREKTLRGKNYNCQKLFRTHGRSQVVKNMSCNVKKTGEDADGQNEEALTSTC